MLLTGAYPRTLDEKLRLAIPKRVRDALGQVEPAVMYLTPGTDGSLALYSEEAFSRLGDKLSQGSPTGQEVRAFSRLFYGQAQPVEVDRQGRVRIPVELATLAGLTKEIFLVGVGDHLEIWDRDRWSVYLAQMQSQYDEVAEKAFARNGAAATHHGAPAPKVNPVAPPVAASTAISPAAAVSEDFRPTQPR